MIDPRIEAHYKLGVETGRLLPESGPRLEFLRTVELLERFLPPAPAAVLDVGGGPGVYASLLTERGYRVHLVDAVALHVEQAGALKQFTAALGDARSLDEPDESFDAVLLLGPLYHLTERNERLRALGEARRVVRAGGVVLAAAISRFASLFDGLLRDRLGDPAFVEIVERDLRDGQHRNPSEQPGWFTSAFFHHPDELADEVRAAGLRLEALLGIEGPGWLFEDRDRGEEHRERLVWAARRVEAEPSLAGLSAHLLAMGVRTG